MEKLIIKDIAIANDRGEIGHECDRTTWLELSDYLCESIIPTRNKQ